MNQAEWIRRLEVCRRLDLSGHDLAPEDMDFMSKVDTLFEALPADFPAALADLAEDEADLDTYEDEAYESVAAASFGFWSLVSKVLDSRERFVRIHVGGQEITILELFPEEQEAKPVYLAGWHYEVIDQGQTLTVGPYGGIVINFDTLQSMALELPEDTTGERILRLRQM